MTISSTTNRVSATGNGVTTSFSFPYPVLAASDLKVYQDGTLKTITTHYTLSGSAPYTSGTNVQFVTAPANGDEVVLFRDTAITQSVDIVDNDPLPASSIETPLDRLTLIAQRHADQLSRAAVFPDTYAGGASAQLPTPTASAHLRWNSSATGLENVTGDESTDTFTQSGTGAVSRLVTAKIAETVTPQDFGAAGDGATNDTAAFEAMLASGAEQFYVPDGTYMIEPTTSRTDPVLGEAVRCGLMMRANQRLRMSSNAVLKQIAWVNDSANDEGGAMILILGVDNVSVEGGVIQGDWLIGGTYTGHDTSSQHGIHIATSTNVTIKDVTCKGWWADGVTVSYWADQANCDNSKNVELINVHCKNNRRNGMSAVGLDGGAIIGGKYASTLGTSPYAGIDLEPNNVTSIASGQSRVRNVRISGVQTTGNYYGIVLTCSAADLVTNNSITGCVVDDGIVLEKANYNTITGNVVKQANDDPDTAAAMSGVRLIDADYNNVAGNFVYDCRRHGIELDASSNHNNVTGNMVASASQKTTNTYSGIYVAGDYNHVAANKVHKGTGGAVGKYGIEIVAGAASNHVFANDLDTGGQTANLIDGSGSTVGAHYDNSVGALIFGADTDLKWGKALVALGGGAAPTLGTIGGSGPASAGQNSWLRVLDSTGAAFWVPVWK